MAGIRTRPINCKQQLASQGGGFDDRGGLPLGQGGPRAAPNGTARGRFGSVREAKPVDRRDHRRGTLVNGVHDLGVVDPAQVHGRDPEVGMPELPLYDDQRYALARHLDRVSMPELVRRKPATQPSGDRGVAQLHTDPGR
jgi:hypothetical protein